MDIFSPSFGVFFWQLVSFLLLLFLAKKFFLKKIINTIQQREEYINRNIKEAREAQSLKAKLDEEIKTNPQATVSLIKINGLDRGNAISEKIIAILKEKLNSDLLFEYKADSYAVISKENLQAVVDNFEELYNKITDFLRDNNAANEVSVGISSASGRNVNAERILLEAGQALEYASQDMDSPIVAFRANPDKYKEYIESSN